MATKVRASACQGRVRGRGLPGTPAELADGAGTWWRFAVATSVCEIAAAMIASRPTRLSEAITAVRGGRGRQSVVFLILMPAVYVTKARGTDAVI